MRWGLLVFAVLSSGLFAVAFSNGASSKNNSSGKPRLCFFELDNPDTSENFITQAGKKLSGDDLDIDIYEIGANQTAERAFKDWIKQMKEENIKCDSLIISGHHTGDWYGGKEQNVLGLKYLEALSCDPKYKNWFKNIKTLWLDGCNTVTDKAIIKSKNPPTPDSETVRVIGKDRPEGKIRKYHITGTSQAYALSLDKNTPLSSRYLRMFPSAQIFGYDGAVKVGKKRAGRSYIVEHLSNLGKALKAEEAQALNKAEADDKRQYLKLGLVAMFSDHCDKDKISAWKKLSGGNNNPREAIENQYYENISQLGCALILAKQLLDNPDSKEAQKALAETIKSSSFIWPDETKELRKALDLANLILNEKAGETTKKKASIELAKLSVLKTLDRITNLDSALEKEPLLKHSHLLFNNIYDTWRTAGAYKEDDKDFFESVQKKLKAKNFKDSIKVRIASPQTSSIRKADYIKFYMEVNDLKLSDIEPKIQKQIDDLVLKAQCIFTQTENPPSCKGVETLRSPRQRELKQEVKRALALSVADQLLQYELLTDSQKKDLSGNNSLFPKNRTDPLTLSTSIRFELSDKGADSLLEELVKNEPPSPRSAAVTYVLTKNFFKNTGNHKQLNNMLNKGVNPDNFSNSGSNSGINKTGFWDAMNDAFPNKTQSEKARIMAYYLNKADTKYVQSQLSNYSYNFDPPEKDQLCELLELNDGFKKFYAKCVIKCLRDIDYTCAPPKKLKQSF